MSTRRHPARSTSIHRARRARQRWRGVRRHRWSGPVDWARALDLVGEDTLAAPAGTPGLQGRASGPVCPSASPRGGGAEPATPAFVELFPALPTAAGPTPWTIELSDPSGRRLTLSLRGAPGPEFVALTHALWKGLR